MEKKNKGGRPRKVKDPEHLMELFKKFEQSKKGILTISGFTFFIEDELGTTLNVNYWYEMNEVFSGTKKRIELKMEERYIELSMDKENATSFLIFYGKNKFNYADKQEVKQTVTTNRVLDVELDE